MTMQKFSDLFAAAMRAIPSAEGLTVAILSHRIPDYAAALVAAGARVLCVDADAAGLLPQDRPDVLIVDAPAELSPRRITLLVAQLRWANPDLVLLLADGRAAADYGCPNTLHFDPTLGPAHAEDALAMARHLIHEARGQGRTAPAIPVLRREGQRRMTLFR